LVTFRYLKLRAAKQVNGWNVPDFFTSPISSPGPLAPKSLARLFYCRGGIVQVFCGLLRLGSCGFEAPARFFLGDFRPLVRRSGFEPPLFGVAFLLFGRGAPRRLSDPANPPCYQVPPHQKTGFRMLLGRGKSSVVYNFSLSEAG
jgi:hypothetical protein